MIEDAWQLEGVTLGGRSGQRLSEVTLSIQPGAIAVIGPSGAGKTSLLNLLVGFERPTSGQITRSGWGEGLPLFWVPQNGGLWSHLSVAEHLRIVAADDQDNRALLHDFDLGDKLTAFPDTLSTGERARLSVARAIASRANVLVLDEPLANVDPASARKYWRVIRDHCTRVSLVFATHSVETVLREADQVICVDQGHVRYAGDKQVLYQSPATPELAEALGPTNWFDQLDDANQWLLGAQADIRSYRPEHLKVEICDESPLQVSTSRYGNTLGELEIIDQRTQSMRTVFHRPTGRRFQAGDRVLLHVVLLLLLICLIPGCLSQVSEPQLTSTAVNHWSIPPAGKVIPAPRSVRFGELDEVFVLDNAGRVLVFSTTGELLRKWEMPAYEVGKPEGICVFKDGRIAVTDTHYHRVVFFDRKGNVLGMHGELGREPGQFVYPVAITQDDHENYYICEYGDNDRVQKFSVDGTFVLEFGTFGTKPGQFQRPSGVVWDDHRVFVADAINNRIQVFSDTGDFEGILVHNGAQPRLQYPYDMVAGDDELFVVEYGAGRVTRLSMAGEVLGRWGQIGSAKGQLTTPWGLAIGADRQLVVADTGNRRLVEIQR